MMWATEGEPEDGSQPSKRGCGVVPPAWSPGPGPGPGPGADPAWHCSPPGPRAGVQGGRRRSSVSDSGDTGIGTYCSEDDSSSSTAPLPHGFAALEDDGGGGGVPVVRVLPSPSSSSRRSLSGGQWTRSSRRSSPLSSPLESPGDVEPPPPPGGRRGVRRWSSLTKLPSGPEGLPVRTSSSPCCSDRHGSLDRGLLHGYRADGGRRGGDLYLPLSSSWSSSLACGSLLLRSPGAGPAYRLPRGGGGGVLDPDPYLCSALSSPVRREPSLAEPSLSSLAPGLEASTLRTQRWLNEQMEYRPGDCAPEPEGPLPWQQGPQHDPRANQSSLPFNMLVKVKEGLLRQRELEIERQKQQIVQLHARIRENELRAQQVLQSQRTWYDQHLDIQDSGCRRTAGRPRRGEELGRKLAVAEWEVLHVNEFFKHIRQKYAEDIHKLEDKIKTRDRYIASLKKKRQRESSQNQEKQQRIETLERYLSELPTLDEVSDGATQEAARRRAEELQAAARHLEESLQEGGAALKEKDVQIQLQAQREEELMASVHSLQQKVQQCLDDGVRVPMQDLKRLEVENCELLLQRDQSCRLFQQQKEQIDRLTSRLTATSSRLQKKRRLHPGHRRDEDKASLQKKQPPPPRRRGGGSAPPETSEVGRLLKEMSLVLQDLQALCSILVQRAQGKEPSLSLLLGMKSFSVSSEEDEGEAAAAEEEEEEEEEEDEEGEEGLRLELLEVGRLRRDIDELRKTISDTTLSMWITAVSLSDGRL